MKKSNCKYSFIDPNDNSSVFDYSPLGLLKATAVIGKGTEGDYKSSTGGFYERYAPSAWMEYDFYAFKNTGNPVWVKTTQREQHWQQDPSPNSPTIVKVEYSDGFGRLLQTRAQAEDVIFGNQTFGSSGLNPMQGQPNDPATGTERAPNSPLNVVVSGWQIYNNKGKVVEQYEPFFDKGFDYQLPGTDGVKITLYYDPLQRVVRTLNPDKSEQRVYFGRPKALNNLSGALPYEPTPWESVAYDANDLASITHGAGSNVPLTDYFTPKSTLIDALGRTIRTTEYWNNSDYNDTIVMQYRYDIRGNLLQVKDPYGRTVFEHVYDLANQPLKNYHIDSGVSQALADATGKPIEANDAKGAKTLSAFDTLQRPTHVWAQNNSSDSLRLTIYSLYGEAAANPKAFNLLGQAWQVYDESGKTESVAFDFKGNLLSKKQYIIDSAVLKAALDNYQTYLVDWTSLPTILDTKVFETSSAFDALNRATKITLPENVNNERKEIVPTYNRAGALEQVRYDGTVYVENIAYNAKGQRLLIVFGNDIMTRYVYQPTTFRLLRQRSEKFTKTQVGNTITYTAVSGTNKQDDKYIYDLIGNIFQINVRTTGCGIGGSNTLDKSFKYDSLYRLIEATGRENVPGGNYPFPGWNDTTRSTDPNTTEAYIRKYQYDKLGNIESLQQIGNNAFTRNFNYANGKNTLNGVSIGVNNYTYLYDSVGNLLTENVNRHYEWDAANQLIYFKNQVGNAEPTVMAQYLYDAGGNRVMKVVRKQGGSYEIRTYIDGVFEHFTDETEEQNTVHVMGNPSRVATIRIGDAMGDTTPSIQYILENNIGSSTVTLDDNGTEINQQEYYPFGETSFGSYTKKRYQYTGKERDDESGLYYYGARYYSPWICRFISADPLAFDFPDKTPYHYSSNNPVNRLDPNGMADVQAVNNTGGENQGTQAAQNIEGASSSDAEKRAGEDSVAASTPPGKKSKSESSLTSSQIKNWQRLVKKGENKFGLSPGGVSDDFLQFLITKTAGKSRFGNQKDVHLDTEYTVKVIQSGGFRGSRRGNVRKRKAITEGNESTGWAFKSKGHNAVGDYSWIINMDAKSEKGTSFAEPVQKDDMQTTGGRDMRTKNMAVYAKVKPIHGFNVYLNTTDNATKESTTQFINGKDYRPLPYYMNPVKAATVTIVSPSTPSDIENMKVGFTTRATSTLSGTGMGMKGANSQYGIYKAYPFSQEIYSKNRVMGLNMDIFKAIGMPRK